MIPITAPEQLNLLAMPKISESVRIPPPKIDLSKLQWSDPVASLEEAAKDNVKNFAREQVCPRIRLAWQSLITWVRHAGKPWTFGISVTLVFILLLPLEVHTLVCCWTLDKRVADQRDLLALHQRWWEDALGPRARRDLSAGQQVLRRLLARGYTRAEALRLIRAHRAQNFQSTPSFKPPKYANTTPYSPPVRSSLPLLHDVTVISPSSATPSGESTARPTTRTPSPRLNRTRATISINTPTVGTTVRDKAPWTYRPWVPARTTHSIRHFTFRQCMKTTSATDAPPLASETASRPFNHKLGLLRYTPGSTTSSLPEVLNTFPEETASPWSQDQSTILTVHTDTGADLPAKPLVFSTTKKASDLSLSDINMTLHNDSALLTFADPVLINGQSPPIATILATLSICTTGMLTVTLILFIIRPWTRLRGSNKEEGVGIPLLNLGPGEPSDSGILPQGPLPDPPEWIQAQCRVPEPDPEALEVVPNDAVTLDN